MSQLNTGTLSHHILFPLDRAALRDVNCSQPHFVLLLCTGWASSSCPRQKAERGSVHWVACSYHQWKQMHTCPTEPQLKSEVDHQGAESHTKWCATHRYIYIYIIIPDCFFYVRTLVLPLWRAI